MTTQAEPGRMNTAVKALWLAALRSGDYEQGHGALKTVDGKYCCLGVLCDLAVEAGVIPAPRTTLGSEDNDGNMRQLYLFGDGDEAGQLAYLPSSVTAWAGVNCCGERNWSTESKYPQSLACLNDAGNSFAEIADIIEAEF